MGEEQADPEESACRHPQVHHLSLIHIFTEIEEELSKYEYTDEELKEIGRIKGQILAKMTKSAVKMCIRDRYI